MIAKTQIVYQIPKIKNKMENTDYEQQLRKKIIEMDEDLKSQSKIIIPPKIKSFINVSDYLTESGIIMYGRINALIGLAEHYQQNFENPNINAILKRRRGNLKGCREALIRILDEYVKNGREKGIENILKMH